MSEEEQVENSGDTQAEYVPEEIANRLQNADRKAAEYYDQLLRLKAEFENFRKRTEREKVEARQWGKQDIMAPMLDLVDVFDQAVQQTQNATDVKSVIQGLGFLHKNFSDFLRAEGLQPLEVVGKTFDPHISEAVEQVEVDPEDAGKVLGEIQRGYTLQGKVLRPARVRVGVAKKSPSQESNLSENTEEVNF